MRSSGEKRGKQTTRYGDINHHSSINIERGALIIIGASNIKEHDGTEYITVARLSRSVSAPRSSKLSEVLRFDPFLWLGKIQMVVATK